MINSFFEFIEDLIEDINVQEVLFLGLVILIGLVGLVVSA